MKMIYGHVEDQESFHSVISNELRDVGIKVPKFTKSGSGNPQVLARLFGGCLSQMPNVAVPQNGFVFQIPKFLVMATSLIRQNIKAEGLFRKGGSIQRQKELKQLLEKGGDLENANVHDVANLVKQFLRCLSEPLLQPRLYDSFVKAYDIAELAPRRKAIFLLCALLPMEHLTVLRFLMGFFAEIASYTAYNKMDSKSLAIVLMPNLFVLRDDLDRKDKSKEKLLQKQTGLVQFLIDNFDQIGSICDHVLEKTKAAVKSLNQSADDLDGNLETRTKLTAKKKRNSLNGVFYGLRKMVQQNRMPSMFNDDGEISDGSGIERTPAQAAKRRHAADKAATHCSSAKKRAMMHLKSEKLVPIPMTHLDSPDPAQNENEISTSPGNFLERFGNDDLHKRKSGRVKFFGKTYLTRRNSVSRSPKQTKKQEKELASTTKKQAVGQVGHCLKAVECSAASPVHLSVSPLPPLPVSHRSVLYTKRKANATSPVCQMTSRSDSKLASFAMNETRQAVRILDQRSKLAIAASGCDVREARGKSSSVLPKASASGASIEIGRKMQKSATKWYQPSSETGQINRLESAHRTRSFISDPAAPSVLAQFASPVRTVIWRPLTKSSLRRGRPNTVLTGLPAPSPFKGSGTSVATPEPSPGMVHYTSDPGPMIDGNRGAVTGMDVGRPRSGNQPVVTRRWNDVVRSKKAKVPRTDDVQKVLVFNKEDDDAGGVLVDDVESKTSLRGVVDVTAEDGKLRLLKCDSGIFETCGETFVDEAEPMDVESSEEPPRPSHFEKDVESLHKSVCKSPSVDSGIHQEECIDVSYNAAKPVAITETLRPASANTNRLTTANVLVSLPGADSNRPQNSSKGCTPSISSKKSDAVKFFKPLHPAVTPRKADGIEWKSAVSVFRDQVDAVYCAVEETTMGRPSLIRLMKDKAGSVTAAARKYDEIASASKAVSGNVKQLERRLSLRSDSPLVRNRALNHQRSVSRDAIATTDRAGYPSGCSDTKVRKSVESRKPKTVNQESKENLLRSKRATQQLGGNQSEDNMAKPVVVSGQSLRVGTFTAKVVLNTSSKQNVQRQSTVSIRRSKSTHTTEGYSPATAASSKRNELLRKSPRLQTRAKLNMVRSRRSSTLQRRSTIM